MAVFELNPLRPLGEEYILVLGIGFHPGKDFFPPFGFPSREVTQSGHEPDMGPGVVKDVQLAREELRLGEVIRPVEAAAVVARIAVRTFR